MIHYQQITKEDVGSVIRLLLVMHEESPAYSGLEPDYDFTHNLCLNIIENNQFGELAFDDNMLVGLMLGHAGNIPFTKSLAAYEFVLYVHPNYRGKIGLKLLHSFEDWAIEKGITYVFLGVSADINSAMVNQMYRKLGYEESGNNFRKFLN